MNVMVEIDSSMDDLDFARAIRLINQVAPDEFKIRLYEHLGYIYKTGNEDIDKNPVLSKQYYKKFYAQLKEAAESGDVKSAHRLAQGYQYGDNIVKDENKALTYYFAAANAGNPISQFHLGCIYRYGWCGVVRDDALYGYWLDRAVDNEWPEALFEKSKLLRESGNFSQAENLLLKASKLGFWPANQSL